ncbi:MAG TPA: hypothetical protein VN611_10470 [Patescibacteria group bacterium]|nr:hypothetical protein [Patescibacteria group bacterium]
MQQKSLLCLAFLFFCANLLMNVFLSSEELLQGTVFLVLTSMILLVMRPLFGFAVLVTEILSLGFFYTYLGFINGWSMVTQSEKIIKLVVFILTLGITWLLILQIKTIVDKLSQAEILVNRYKKYEDEAEILTLNEFLYRGELLHIAMKRRGENGYILRIRIIPGRKSFAMQTLFENFSRAAVRTIRENYDLIGKISDNELAVFLQNTHADGVKIVTERFVKNLNAIINVPAYIYEIQVSDIGEKWQDVQFALSQPVLRQSRRLRAEGE